MYNMSGRNDIFLISYYIYYLFIIFLKKYGRIKPQFYCKNNAFSPWMFRLFFMEFLYIDIYLCYNQYIRIQYKFLQKEILL